MLVDTERGPIVPPLGLDLSACVLARGKCNDMYVTNQPMERTIFLTFFFSEYRMKVFRPFPIAFDPVRCRLRVNHPYSHYMIHH